jgi:hypothetical protein
MKIKQKIAHWLVGHIPYYVYEKDIPNYKNKEKVYYCSLCREELTGGVYHWLYDKDNKRQV